MDEDGDEDEAPEAVNDEAVNEDEDEDEAPKAVVLEGARGKGEILVDRVAVARAGERVHLREGVGVGHPRRPAERLVLEPPVAVAVAEAAGEAAVRLVFAGLGGATEMREVGLAERSGASRSE